MTKLLIVDDNTEMRELVKSIVRKVSDRVFECADGAEALASYAACRPDWVLMDWEMKRGLRCEDYFGARKFVTHFSLRGDPEQRSHELRLPRGVSSS